MLDAKDYGILKQIIKRCERIETKIKNISQNQFYLSEDIIEVICFNLFQIGELVSKLSTDFIDKYDRIPWRPIKGMRNKIVHGYDTIDKAIVWNTTEISIPILKNYCLEIVDFQRELQDKTIGV